LTTDNRRDVALPLILGAVTTLLHLLTAVDDYGIFRDELYYVACARNLDWGYVDHPPLAPLLARVFMTILGTSMLALRVLPALAGGATVFLTGMMAREMGGGRFAMALAGVATAIAPAYVASFGFLSMNALDVLVWAAAAWVLMRLFRTGDTWWWIPFGVVAGLGLQNKISILFLGTGVVAGVIVTRQWKHFTRRHLWIGGAIAFVIFLPHLIWQVTHGWPTLEFMERATQNKIAPLAPIEFLSAQVLMMNPVVVPLALAGLGFYLFAVSGKPFRALGPAFLVVVLLLITQRSKPYYLTASYTWLFSAGAVWVGSFAARRRWGWLRPVALVLVTGTGLALAPLAKPILPVETYVAYAQRLGVAPSTDEIKEVGRLPQFFADRLGWREMAETVAAVHRSLPETERESACVFGQNYGHAGAIDFYRDEFGLPPAVAGHNNYHLWGPRGCSGDLWIVIDAGREGLERIFEEVELATTFTCDDCMPYEAEKPIWVCRRMMLPVEELWPRLRHFD
jgi:hypothetical protein